MAAKAVLFTFLCICLILSSSLLASCDADNSISTRYPCQFIFRTIYHPGSSIETALQGAGTYTMISAKKINGAWNIYSTLNDGKNQTETIVLSTAKENYANYSYLGAGNNLKDATKNGFILGTSNFNDYVAWDRQCLNCILQYGGTNYPLEWTGNRLSVICNKCKRVYSLENGTITSGGQGKEDKMLMQYRVTYTGIGSVLTVGN
ncbi:hypothetical protein [Segatella copri]|uniref:hypothetical protein n=1 Tax=Segatella copri TaxID=165179 RepID=UPI00294AE3A4|nr:hypothetical protein [Segatella copri]